MRKNEYDERLKMVLKNFQLFSIERFFEILEKLKNWNEEKELNSI
jgi:hypothetical protein